VALQARVMQSLELLADNRIAVMMIHKEDFAQTKSAVTDTENLINLPLQIRTVEISALFTETPEPGPIRISLRSKGHFNCATFAEQFGGGGHARAAGLKVNSSLQEAHQQVVQAIIDRIDTDAV
ncbi:MAG TPA: DHHA1 domain-containing protein, partial [Tepidisphaeraceae bacterium]|nr:DHHA1 domain-containing protein [Tepidisphaeraceae bacterium]